MPISPLSNSTNFPVVAISVNGKDLSDAHNLLSVDVYRSVNTTPEAAFAIMLPEENPYDSTAMTAFPPGARVEIKAGYGTATGSIFQGVILRQRITNEGDQEGNELILYCQDDKAERAEVGQVDITDKSILELTCGMDVFSFDLETDGQTRLVRASRDRYEQLNLEGAVSFPGSPAPALWAVIDLNGFGAAINGGHLITSVHHIIEEGEWITETGFGEALLVVDEPVVTDPEVTEPADTTVEEPILQTIVSRSGLKIGVNDEDEVLTISTPGENSIVLSDKGKSIVLTDQHGNTVTMDSGGITLESGKDITIKAGGKLTLAGSQGVDVSSRADVSVKGLNVHAEGQVGATLKGGASAELSAGGQTVVKGAMVMIN